MIAMKIVLLLYAIAIALSAKLLQSEYRIYVVEGIKCNFRLLLISFLFEHSVHCVSSSVGKTSHWKLYGLSENQSQEGSD